MMTIQNPEPLHQTLAEARAYYESERIRGVWIEEDSLMVLPDMFYDSLDAVFNRECPHSDNHRTSGHTHECSDGELHCVRSSDYLQFIEDGYHGRPHTQGDANAHIHTQRKPAGS